MRVDAWRCDGCRDLYESPVYAGTGYGARYKFHDYDMPADQKAIRILTTHEADRRFHGRYGELEVCSPDCLFTALDRMAFLKFAMDLRDYILKKMAERIHNTEEFNDAVDKAREENDATADSPDGSEDTAPARLLSSSS
jgi:hypothetical protein